MRNTLGSGYRPPAIAKSLRFKKKSALYSSDGVSHDDGAARRCMAPHRVLLPPPLARSPLPPSLTCLSATLCPW